MKYQISVLQLKDFDDIHYYLFSSLEFLKDVGLKVELKNYDTIYNTSIEYDGEVMNLLEELFIKFQGKKPEEYKGHSLSVSDIITLNDDYYYCNDFGFVKL